MAKETTSRRRSAPAPEDGARALAVGASGSSLRRLLHGGSAMMTLFDETGRLQWANRSFLQLLGRNESDLLRGLYWSQITPPDWSEADEAALQELRSGRSAPVYEKELLTGDGRRLPALVSLGRISGEAQLYSATALDLREHRRMESLEHQMRQTQKLDAIGRLAGGVAHDFNNLLMIILSNVQLAQDETTPHSPAMSCLEEAVRACDRAAELTQQLLAFGRRQQQRIEEIDVVEAVRETVDITRRILGENISVDFAHDGQRLRAHMDRSQLTQTIVHLLFNARDAMQGCGRISIRLRRCDSAGATGHGEPLPRGPHLLLQIADDGPGMDAATRDSLFEPFFTTKEFGQGRGMGLAAVYGAVKQNGGYIYVDSAPGEGASFRLYFPLATAELCATARPGDGGTILLVEDEAPLRSAIKRRLCARGFRVIEAGDGDEACRLAGEEAQNIDLLLSDVAMPRMGGVELAERLRRLRPRLPVLLMSGYADNDEARRIEAPIGLLYKPFSMSSLDERIRQFLGRPAATPDGD